METIEKLSIPDEDMPGWIRTLHEGGFSQNEIDYILTGLNKTYSDMKKPEMIKMLIENVKRRVLIKTGRLLTPEQTQYLMKAIEEKFKDKQPD